MKVSEFIKYLEGVKEHLGDKEIAYIDIEDDKGDSIENGLSDDGEKVCIYTW